MAEVVGTIAACIELAKTLHAAIVFIDGARDVSKHATEQRQIQLQLRIELHRFQAWCDEIGIPSLVQGHENSTYDVTTNEEVFVKRIRESDLRLDSRGLSELTAEILLDMQRNFECVQQILDARSSAPLHANSTVGGEVKEKRKGSWMSRWKTRFVATRNNSPSNGNLGQTSTGHKVQNVQNALRWVSSDKKNLGSLMAAIQTTNEALLYLLGPLSQQRVRRKAQGATLNDEISSDPLYLPGLDGDDDLGSLARIKSFHVQGEVINNEIEGNSKPPRLQVFRPERLGPEIAKAGVNRSVHRLDAEAVLVEWKLYSKEKRIRVDRILQLNSLAVLLNHRNIHKKFLAPECKGLIEDDENSRLGVVFRISNIPATNTTTELRPRIDSLQQFIRTPTTVPSLGERFKMARELALAVYNLHSVHWLHKSIRSDNILFLGRRQDSRLSPESKVSKPPHSTLAEDVGDERPRASSHIPATFQSLHILGWEISRPDGPSEFSESLSYSSEGYQATRENVRLYSHPEVHPASKATGRARYRSQYDVYSLGLVLLEIGLCKTLDYLRKRCSDDADFRNKLRGEYCDKLLPTMGHIYWQATKRCITYDFGVDTSAALEEIEKDGREGFLRYVVNE
ncbi:prion-inhibition and propagation-domain-containing protein [Apiospora rasikravindrae]|uniref:Prion-inhibition and propagation-domain-containing protein n=1 Tax=Apiospora rasikravindrae TaxID=990691 RepID=A0ABR1SZN4_9PEZI